jgi:isoleucyl-tRNA synthetase
MADAPDKPDYRSTVFLPRTDFPMKAGLPQKEPAILARWLGDKLYGKLRESRAGREKFILHDGPPYANGDMHIGHALNHILKDMVVRTQTLLGKDAPYVPGWDCHGLPIEWKVEEQYRKKKLNKDEVPIREFRAECRAMRSIGSTCSASTETARHRRRLGQSVPDDGLSGRSDDRRRADEVRRKRPALPRRQAGDVAPGREDRARRSRDRI